MEDGRLVELHQESGDNQFSVGDIFLGRVKRLLPSMNAAFVDVGHERDGFLHYLDLGPQFQTQAKFLRQMLESRGEILGTGDIRTESDIDKYGKIPDVLKANQIVLVQIMKEAISSKGPRLASQLSIAGQYLILMPFSSDVAISRKMRDNRRKKELKRFLLGIRPENCGIIVRTAAEDIEFDVLEDELKRLFAKFQTMIRSLVGSRPPKKVLSEMDRTSSLMRDMLSLGLESIVTDDDETYAEIDKYLKANLPDQQNILKLNKPRQGLFNRYNIERQIKGAFGKTVNLPNGAYLVIEHTEALHSIDINSGSLKSNNANSPEENALRVNLDAAKEIARQLRLRDMGGIVVIDFIDQRRIENKKAIHQKLKDEMSRDRAKHAVLPMSKFGLIEVTRQRVRPEVKIDTDEVCPNCNGTGKVRPSILLAEEIHNNLEYLIRQVGVKSVKLVLNPYVAAFLKSGSPSLRWKWFRQFGKWIKLETSDALAFTEVEYLDRAGEQLKLD